jgi:hypothetical protein
MSVFLAFDDGPWPLVDTKFSGHRLLHAGARVTANFHQGQAMLG